MATHSILLPEKSHGERSLVGHSPWGYKDLDTTEWLSTRSSRSDKAQLKIQGGLNFHFET